MSQYTIRRFRDGDVDGILQLFTLISSGPTHDREWFTWKFEANPFVDHVPIVVAERDGVIVGARPFFALGMAVGGEPTLAIQPCDTMVHPDHRRRGLFTRMTERSIERYADRGPSFFFNFPNDLSAGGYRKLGWERVGVFPRSYRVTDPRRVLGDGTFGPLANVVAVASTPLVAGYDSIRRVLAPADAGSPVRHDDHVTATELASIYREGIPDSIHARRDERFYRWRFDNPDWAYSTYFVDGEAGRVGLVVGNPVHVEESAPSVTRIVDVVPLENGDRSNQVATLLRRVIADNAGADLFVVPDDVVQPSTRRALGFWNDGSLPLSLVMDQRRHVARSLDGWVRNGVDIRDPANWTLTFAEMDTG